MDTKTYKCKGLEYYVTNCYNVYQAVLTLLNNKVGVTENNLEIFEGEIPEGANVFDGTL